jgi:hypothetical protein
MKVYESSEKGEMVMTKIFRILALLAAASLLLWIAGCGGDDDDDDCTDNVAPTVTLSPNGGDIASNSTITATCSKAVDTLTATGATPTSGDNKVWTFQLGVGAGQAVSVVATDSCGDTGEASATFNVSEPDIEAPELVGGDCEPEDGDDGIDPADVEEIVLVFSEPLSGAELTAFEPDGDVNAELDGDTVTIAFLGNFSLGNEQEIVVEMTVEDLAGNTADVEYGFTTTAKE